ncbi:alpha/beta fold hydrolase [Euryhalocaulis caribicus]|uniref:alpha/beta fold hydrolase n=1 Tax=Euryhalocaulis caribicus TaxID=1161401 RepID=UPI00039A70D6|nr:alpha/beta hydrolase [Euryhalocaulis caribicus]
MPKTKPTVDNPDGRPERTFPLARYGGDRPPRPGWFEALIGNEPEPGESEVEGARITWQRWGDPGKPGVVLVHGGVAHMKWWDFIGPALAKHRCVTALNLSGMGESDWRDEYRQEIYAREVMTAAKDSGAMKSGVKPVMIGHSFGGFVMMELARQFGEDIGGAVILDSPIRPPGEQRRSAPPKRGGRIYKDLPEALARFRLLPDQDCENPYIVDHIARHSLKPVTTGEGEQGWTWKFDPALWQKMQYPDHAPAEYLKDVACPLAVMRGEISALLTGEVWRYMASILPEGTPMISIPEARHHLMLDQPLALIAALRTLLSAWPRPQS